MTDNDRASAAIDALREPHHDIAAPPVIYDLPQSPLLAVLAALRGGDRWPVALVVAGVVLAIVGGLVLL